MRGSRSESLKRDGQNNRKKVRGVDDMSRPNQRRIKKNRSYSVYELARVCNVTRKTVRRWHKDGLPAIDSLKPFMFQGKEACDFLGHREQQRRWRCAPAEIYCVACRRPKIPLLNFATYFALTDVVGMLVGKCPDCQCQINRFVSSARLRVVRGDLNVRVTGRQPQLVDSEELPVDGHLKQEREDANTQRKK
jgi:hypothetical protein